MKGEQSKRPFYALVAVLLMLQACSALRPVPPGKYLYEGAEVKIEGEKTLTYPKVIRAELEALLEPKPNNKFLWARPGLYLFSLVQQPKKEKGFRYWLKYKIGEPPVMLNEVDSLRISGIMSNRLYHRGYFYNQVNFEIVKKKKTARILYDVHPGPQYKIDSVIFPQGNNRLARDILKLQEGTLLKKDIPYNLELLKSERERIDRALKDEGYYHFGPDFLGFEVDTALGDHRLRIWLKIKLEIPVEASRIYYLRKVVVLPDFTLKDYNPDTLYLDGYQFLDNTGRFKPTPILNHVLLDSGKLYSRSDHLLTLRQLMGLRGFQYSTIRFVEDDSLKNALTASVILTPKKRYALSFEANAIAKTNNFAGPGVKLSYKDRNIFKGVEQFFVDFNGRFEVQVGAPGQVGSNIELKLETGLRIPRTFPFPFSKNNRQYVPFTNISVGLGWFKRDSVARVTPLYTLASFFVSYSYDWQTSQRVTHKFQLADISFTNLIDASQYFRDYLDDNPSVKRSFEEQFVLGSNYIFTYNNLPSRLGNSGFLFSGGVSGSGNFVSLGYRILEGSWPDSEDPVRIGNAPPYSQYFRVTPEFRYYLGIGKTTLATRLLLGVAFPYGNSQTIPYIKQFYVGGANSLRAFRARSVGPGGYQSESDGNLQVDQAGDVKIEGNLEYRLSVFKYLQLALFLDAGNIWLFYPDENRPLAEFDPNRFYKELAIGTGLGFRIDLQVIVVRFDFAFPLRDPSLPEDERWRIKAIDFPNPDWRRNNIILNFSIGYPF